MAINPTYFNNRRQCVSGNWDEAANRAQEFP